MNKLIYVLPWLLGLAACGPQPPPTPDVEEVVSAILTASAQNEREASTPSVISTPATVQAQPTVRSTSTPANLTTQTPGGTMTYFWPLDLPAGFILNRENSLADASGFELIFINSSNHGTAMSLRLLGSAAGHSDACLNDEPVTVRGLDGCFPSATGAGFAVEWQENGAHYLVGGMGFSKELALATAEQLESIDLATFLERLADYNGN